MKEKLLVFQSIVIAALCFFIAIGAKTVRSESDTIDKLNDELASENNYRFALAWACYDQGRMDMDRENNDKEGDSWRALGQFESDMNSAFHYTNAFMTNYGSLRNFLSNYPN